MEKKGFRSLFTAAFFNRTVAHSIHFYVCAERSKISPRWKVKNMLYEKQSDGCGIHKPILFPNSFLTACNSVSMVPHNKVISVIPALLLHVMQYEQSARLPAPWSHGRAGSGSLWRTYTALQWWPLSIIQANLKSGSNMVPRERETERERTAKEFWVTITGDGQ